MRLLKRFPRPDLVRFLMEESELEREVELLEGSVEGRLMSEKGVPERYVLSHFEFSKRNTMWVWKKSLRKKMSHFEFGEKKTIWVS